MKIFLILENIQLDKKFIENSKKHKDRETEIEILKNKLAALTSNINVNNNAMNPPLQYDPRQVTFSANDDEIVNNSPLQNKHQKFVSDVNKKNVDDLEALYFNDKIEMKTMLLREHGQHLLQAYFRKNSIVFKNVIEGC